MKRIKKQTTLQEIQDLMKEFARGQIDLRKGSKELREDLRAEAAERKKALATEKAERKKALAERAEEWKQVSLGMKKLQAEVRAIAKDNKRRTDALEELFTGQWGKLMETLVEGDLIRLLNERGVYVNDIAREREKIFEGKEYEFDIVAIDGDIIVVVEVKTTLRLRDINAFIKKLEMFKTIFPRYRDNKILGAMAWLKANEGGKQRVIREGLFAIKATGNSSSIVNPENFKPKAF